MSTNNAQSQLADDLYAQRDDDAEWEEEQIEVRPAKTAVISCRIPREELDALEAVAAARGESVSQGVRRAITMLVGVRTPQVQVQVLGADANVQVAFQGVKNGAENLGSSADVTTNRLASTG